MNKHQAAIKDSGLPMLRIAELTGINYKKIYRVSQGEGHFKLEQYQKLMILNHYIERIKKECEVVA